MGSLASIKPGGDTLRFETCRMGNGRHNPSFRKRMVSGSVWHEGYDLVGDRNFSKDVPVPWNFGAWFVPTRLEGRINFSPARINHVGGHRRLAV